MNDWIPRVMFSIVKSHNLHTVIGISNIMEVLLIRFQVHFVMEWNQLIYQFAWIQTTGPISIRMERQSTPVHHNNEQNPRPELEYRLSQKKKRGGWVDNTNERYPRYKTNRRKTDGLLSRKTVSREIDKRQHQKNSDKIRVEWREREGGERKPRPKKISRAENQPKNKSGGRTKARTYASTRPWTVNDTRSRTRKARSFCHALVLLIGATAKETALPTQLLEPQVIDLGAQIPDLPFKLPYLMLPRFACALHLLL
jgi:hypothetical protein